MHFHIPLPGQEPAFKWTILFFCLILVYPAFSQGTCVTPSITISPTNARYCFGNSTQFWASVSNAGSSVSYQWKKNGVALPTYTNDNEIIAAAINDVITCELTTTNSCGSRVTVVSNSVTIQPNPGYDRYPEVTIAATQETICTGTAVTFTATNVSQSVVLSYQWLVNGSPVGTNSTVFTTNTLTDGAKVECIMFVPHCHNAGAGSTKDNSDPIIMKVHPQLNPKVSITPVAAAICKGIPLTFTAKAENAGTNPTYQWKVNDMPVGTNSHTFTSTTFNHDDRVTCEVTIDPAVSACTNGTGAVSNSVTLSVSDAFTPSIVVSASQQEICQGTTVTFTAVGTDTGLRPTYQWQVNGVNVGTNNTEFTTDNISDGDKISCILTPVSSCGSVATSDAVTMIVHPNPDVRFATPSVVIEPGTPFQLTPIVQGTIANHQWTPSSMLTNPGSLTPTTLPLTIITTFTLWVQTAAGCVDTASFTVNAYNKLYMPNSFTPNGDGKNDVFRIPSGAPIVLKEFSVYDRWGGLVFHTTDKNKGWDGKQKGTNATAGTYIFIVRAEDINGELLLKGTVQLIR